MTIQRRDTKFRQSVESVTLGCANMDVSKTSTQRHSSR